MSQHTERETLSWRTQYEACEDRLVLSAHPLDQAELRPLTDDSPPAQYGALQPAADDSNELTADLAYIRQQYGLRGTGQTVAIIDSGIAYDHLALGSGLGPSYRVVGGWDFTEENDADPYDDPPAGFHGTHVAGIIGSSDTTHPGVAPDVDLVALRVFNDQGVGRLEWLEDALQWVHEHRGDFPYPITAVNLSLATRLDPGDTAPRDLLEDEFAQLKADGIFVAVAAGNAFEQTDIHALSYPAASSYVVPVGSVDPDGQLSSFSQRDQRVLLAPGEYVTSTVPSFLFGSVGVPNDFAYAHGTSMATPYVAGASVLVREAMQDAGYQTMDQEVIEQLLRDTATPVFDDVTLQTYLRMDLKSAIDAVYASQAAVHADGPLTPLEGGVRIVGTAGDDTIEATIGDGSLQVVLNGQRYEWSTAEVRRVEFLGGGGYDQATLRNEAGDGSLQAYPDHVEWDGSGATVRLEGCARVLVQALGGGYNTANLHGFSGNDRLYAWPDAVALSGNGFQYRVEGFARVEATAGAGGSDVAYINDSAGNDRLYSYADYTAMSGQGYYNCARGFSTVYAYATIGGDDQAQLYDTPGDDRFHGRATSASFAGSDHLWTVSGFDRVSAFAVAGGADQAFFDDSVGDDRFRAYPNYATMTGAGYFNYAQGFDQVHAESGRGADEATLYGSFRDDAVTLGRDQTELAVNGVSVRVAGFGAVRVYGGGGADRAVFDQVGADDSFHGQGNEAAVANAAVLRAVYDFDEVTLRGERIPAELTALDYVFHQAGDV